VAAVVVENVFLAYLQFAHNEITHNISNQITTGFTNLAGNLPRILEANMVATSDGLRK
jgi:hypothetical protein